MITQCSIRHLYTAASEPGLSYFIDRAKTYERRRCGHKLMIDLSFCVLKNVYHPSLILRASFYSKGGGTNQRRYIVASQDLEVRKVEKDSGGGE